MYKISADGSSISNYMTGFSGASNCYDMAINPATGILYVLDGAYHVMYQVFNGGGTKAVFAGLPGVSGNVDGTGTVARFMLGAWPGCGGMDFDSINNQIIMADTNNNKIRKVSLSREVTTIPVSGGQNLINPRDITFNPNNGNYYFYDYHRIWQVNPSGVFTILAGTTSSGSVNGAATSATFNGYSIAYDSLTNGLFLADNNNVLVRRLDLSTMQVSTTAGIAGSAGYIDGAATSSYLSFPDFIASDLNGNMFVCDFSNNRIRKIIACLYGSSFDQTSKVCVYSTCPAGLQLTSGKCVQCSAGKYKSGSGTFACFDCPVGQESSSDRSACVSCVLGTTYRASLSYSSCLSCPTNAVCNSVTNYTCNAGYINNATMTGCTACPSNQESNAARIACSACDAVYQYFSPSTKICLACPYGSTCNGVAFTCNVGYVVNANGNGCTLCPANQEANAGRTACNACLASQYFNSATKLCTSCPTGASCNAVTYTCNSGYEPTQDGSGCQLCGEGYSKSSSGNGACSQCAIGT